MEPRIVPVEDTDEAFRSTLHSSLLLGLDVLCDGPHLDTEQVAGYYGQAEQSAREKSAGK